MLGLLLALCLGADTEAPRAETPETKAIGATAPDTVVVCPEAWRSVMKPWLEHRQAQGHRLAWLASELSASELTAALRDMAGKDGETRALKYLLLVGDAAHPAESAALRATRAPGGFVKARVNALFGSEPEIASDNVFADLDGDRLPDLAVGRLPVDSAEELAAVVDKILAYENCPDMGHWRRQVNVVAGVGGFGALVDGALEFAARKLLTDGLPDEYNVSFTYGSWRSPYFPDPRRFHETTLRRLNEGCLFWVYIGHGQRSYLQPISTPAGEYAVLSTRDKDAFHAAHGAPIAVLLACYAGAFDGPRDCLAEEMVKSPRGPVAALAGSRVTMPYAMSVLGLELLNGYFVRQHATLGDLIVDAKRQLASEPAADSPTRGSRALLNTAAGLLSPKPALLAEERREHLDLFNLLGDPLLRLRRPEPITLRSPAFAAPGDTLEVEVTSPLAGKAVLELVCRRDQTRVAARPRVKYDGGREQLEGFHADYEDANEKRYWSRTIDLPAGASSWPVLIPTGARGPCQVRVHAQGERAFGLGAARVTLLEKQPPPKEQAAPPAPTAAESLPSFQPPAATPR